MFDESMRQSLPSQSSGAQRKRICLSCVNREVDIPELKNQRVLWMSGLALFRQLVLGSQ